MRKSALADLNIGNMDSKQLIHQNSLRHFNGTTTVTQFEQASYTQVTDLLQVQGDMSRKVICKDGNTLFTVEGKLAEPLNDPHQMVNSNYEKYQLQFEIVPTQQVRDKIYNSIQSMIKVIQPTGPYEVYIPVKTNGNIQFKMKKVYSHINTSIDVYTRWSTATTDNL